MEDSGVGHGVGMSSTRGRAVEVVVHSYDREVEAREERGVLVEVCKMR